MMTMGEYYEHVDTEETSEEKPAIMDTGQG